MTTWQQLTMSGASMEMRRVSVVEDFIVVRLYKVSQSFWLLLKLIVSAKFDTFLDVGFLRWSQSWLEKMISTICCIDDLPLAVLSSLAVF